MHRLCFFLLIYIYGVLPSTAQQVYSLSQCRELALHNNKIFTATQLKKDMALNAQKAARTLRLPKVNALASYQLFDRELSILNADQKYALSHLGTNFAATLTSAAGDIVSRLLADGIISSATANALTEALQRGGIPIATAGDNLGKKIRSAFRTDTHQMWVGSVMLTQPIYVGGAITAANRMADISVALVDDNIEMQRQATLYDIDKTYWTIVALAGKQRLAASYLDLVRQLSRDVHVMIDEGVATRADGLKVDVRVNEAEMQQTQVDNGVSLARMLLCQQCGLPISDSLRLADEGDTTAYRALIADDPTPFYSTDRPEVRLLQGAVDLSRQQQKLTRAAYLPQVALTGGYLISNPNAFNGFERRFKGMWNVGLTARIPIWSWNEGRYKLNMARTATRISEIELEELTEKIDLQIAQGRYKVTEAKKKLASAVEHIRSAEENLRCANVGFREGVIDATDVMAAQTAWQQAMSQKIDAEVELRLAQVALSKALGRL
ncbi:MAG: TolC family protein [Bacteroidaceae bacterium]|nr:TolC family protein [Bacteroidaceae bacterium]